MNPATQNNQSRETDARIIIDRKLREAGRLDYLILPLHEVEKAIEQEFVHVVGKGKFYRITITHRQDKIFLGRRENDVSYCLNRWEVIK